METDITKYPTESLEEGELSDSDDGYTPLQRPETNKSIELPRVSVVASNSKMDDSLSVEDSLSESDGSSDTSSDSANVLKRPGDDSGTQRKKNKKSRFTGRLKPLENIHHRPKKYNVWTASIQEESLMENMRGFDVAKDPRSDRSVENYDYSLKYRLNGENRLKRRLSSSSNQFEDGYNQSCKRSKNEGYNDSRGRRISASSSSSSLDNQNSPRHILDLNVGPDSEGDDIAREIANKLYEEKDDLLLRVVEVLGTELSIELFKETQKIEKDGGMMIMNGKRRRTPGGVFLFLLKHHDKVTADDKKTIFEGEAKQRKILQAFKRDQKVEELKKRLNLQDKELKPLSSRASRISISHLKPESNGALSNPPPSPVANGAQESSPDYSSQPINHVNDNSPDKVSSRELNDLEDDSLTAYDDYLDMHCDEMDLF